MGLTTSELDDDVASLVGEWQIHNLSGYYTMRDGLRFDVLWRKPNHPNSLYHTAIENLNFHALNGNYIGMGWRPAFLHSWSRNPTDIRHTAIWVPNEGLDLDYLGQLDSMVTPALEANNIPALSLVISHDGRLVFNRAWG